MGKKSPSAPAAPDPAATSAAQTTSNKETAYYNSKLANMDQYTPYGSLNYTFIGTQDDPKWRSDIQLSPEGKQLFDQQMQQDLAINDTANNYLQQIRNISTTAAPQADDAARQRIEAALMERLNPYIEKDRAAQEARLANQGITYGSEAYSRAQDDFGRNVNDARLAAIAQAGDEQSRLFALDTAARQIPLNEYNALRSSAQLQTPQFQSGGNAGMGGTDVAGNIWKNYQGNLDAYNNKVASQNSRQNALFGLGGSLGAAYLMAPVASSDRRLKTNIERIGTTKGGIPLYKYKYKGSDHMHIGVMADEIRRIVPDAVVKMHNGYDAVDYSKVY